MRVALIYTQQQPAPGGIELECCYNECVKSFELDKVCLAVVLYAYIFVSKSYLTGCFHYDDTI
jgi:hypothetical protein